MKRHVGMFCAFAAIALLATFASTAAATPLAVNNGSFENNALPAGGMSADYDANVLEVSPGYTLVQAFQANDNAGVESYPGWFDVMTLIGVSGQSNLVTYHLRRCSAG